MICCVEVLEGVTFSIEDVFMTTEGDVAEAKGCGSVVAAGVAVFVWAHEEVESNPDEVYNALLSGAAVVAAAKDVMYNGGGDGFDP